jgi:hypothetical protein
LSAAAGKRDIVVPGLRMASGYGEDTCRFAWVHPPDSTMNMVIHTRIVERTLRPLTCILGKAVYCMINVTGGSFWRSGKTYTLPASIAPVNSRQSRRF